MNIYRRALCLAACGTAAGMYGRVVAAPNLSKFERMLAEALRDPGNLQGARAWREQAPPSGLLQAGPPPFPPSERTIAPEAIRMIVLFEVSSSKIYGRKYRKPVWPGGASGPTIGIGYDLGYSTRGSLSNDWHDYLDNSTLQRLAAACGKTGDAAREFTPSLHDVSIPWDAAFRQFKNRLIPRFTAETIHYLPRAQELSDKSLGALVSLVYNRGASFSKEGKQFDEMRAIKSAIDSGQFSKIPDELIAMKKLWPEKGFAGLRLRRELEAQLFKDGLA